MKTLTTRKQLLSLLISQALVAPAQSAVFNINCGDVAQLINAINTANSNSAADKINLNVDNQANCVYPLTVANNNTEGTNGLPSIINPITINGNQSVIRRREGSEGFRIVHVAETGNLTLKQLSVENGLIIFLPTQKSWELAAGGIFNRGKLALENSTVSGNTSIYGGGILNFPKATAELTNSTVSGNTSSDNGGGIYNRGSTTLTNSMVSGNTSNKGGGGGIFNGIYATATLTNSTVSGNIAKGGGGIFNDVYATTMLTNSTVSGNNASWGGGIYNLNYTVISITNSTIWRNTASYYGGGICNHNSTVTLINSSILMNTASGQPASSGGGIYNDMAIVTLTNSTVLGNTANEGGGILNHEDSIIMVKNTILTGNNADFYPDCNNMGTLTANHYNLFGGDGTECNAGATDLTLTGLGKTITDVLNPTLANNGGPTQTLALIANSPAIDAADDAVCPATDQRGVSRPQGTKCDIGAFEYQKPGLIELGDFQAIATSQGIYLKWITTSAASDNAGFRLWRATPDSYGGYTHITLLDHPQAQTLTATPLEAVTDWSHLIAEGSSAECYSYLDAGAAPAGTTYFYLLEDVNMGGYRTLHWDDIVSATVGQNSNDNPQCEDE